MENEHREQVAKAATIVMIAILVSRILGFIRERAVAEVFGRTATTDVFFAAFALPDLMFQLLVGGALSSAFIPVFTHYLAKEEEKEAWYVASVFECHLSHSSGDHVSGRDFHSEFSSPCGHGLYR